MCLASGGWLAVVSLGDGKSVSETPQVDLAAVVQSSARLDANTLPQKKTAFGLRQARMEFSRADGSSVGNQAVTNSANTPPPIARMPAPHGMDGYALKKIPSRSTVFAATNQTHSAPAIVITNTHSLMPENFPSPGIYAATPYSGLVLVPEPIDTAFVVAPPLDATMDHCFRVPELRLDPKY